MADSIPAPLDTQAPAQRLCEKCRHSFPLDQFVPYLTGLECVCRRCLQVMGYRLKGGQ